ncbi:hypothetical protein [Facklamia hominis]|uniref:DUF1659 domain-containing protein n=1 Tax=Facklamia hominis TaxID=178214 RepID=A0AAJ1Q7N8_9LACT|nr:hypothetical protein [Facklamia hominis]EPH09987.1 hypothetical protein HMPREF9260_01201 [Facklamia hominis ACS-120-V-Sch10]MDK7188055.1 hypothetical protein [Facklamia hominis]
MSQKTFKSGRLSLKSLDPESKKTSSVSLNGLTEAATVGQVQGVKTAIDNLLDIPSQTVEGVYTYQFN